MPYGVLAALLVPVNGWSKDECRGSVSHLTENQLMAMMVRFLVAQIVLITLVRQS